MLSTCQGRREDSVSPLRPLTHRSSRRRTSVTDQTTASSPSTPSRCPSGTRSVPATPPPCYGAYARGSPSADAPAEAASALHQCFTNSTEAASASSTTAAVTSFSTPPRIDRRDRSQLLILEPGENAHQPVTPPPTYPSPPDYRTPPRGANGLPIAQYYLAPVAGDDAYIDMNDEETALHELAPEYKDDVGFLAGVKHSGHVICLVLTVLLYTLIALYFLGGFIPLPASIRDTHNVSMHSIICHRNPICRFFVELPLCRDL